MISEKGVFHSASFLKIGTNSEWLGLQPYYSEAKKKINVDSIEEAKERRWIEGGPAFLKGRIDPSDRSDQKNFWVTCEVEDEVLRKARDRVIEEFKKGEWKLIAQDCIDFTAALARYAGLNADESYLLPYLLVLDIWRRNDDKVVDSNLW